ncbi:MAG: hypothetical protein ACI9U2_000810 [Bradymonadia bacterium]|jgi:hypothetical protein
MKAYRRRPQTRRTYRFRESKMVTTFAVLVGLMAGGAGKIELNVSPNNAIVEVDGKQIKSRTVSVKAGNHKVVVRASGHSARSQTVRVASGKKTKVTIRLKRSTAKKAVVRAPGRKGVTVIGRRPAAKKPIKRGVKGKKIAVRRPVNVRRPVKKTVVRKTVKKKTVGRKVVRKTVKKKTTVVKRRPAKRTTGKRRPAARNTVRGNRGGGRGGSQSLRPWAILSFVVGGAAVTGGYITSGIAQDRADEFNTSSNRTEKLSLHKKAKDMETVSTVLYGVGATGVVLGALLLAMDPGDRRATVSPIPGGGAMVGYTGSF